MLTCFIIHGMGITVLTVQLLLFKVISLVARVRSVQPLSIVFMLCASHLTTTQCVRT